MAKGTFEFTSESVTEGHPDKVCDAISDAVLDAVLEGDTKENFQAKSRVACETFVSTGLAVVGGEITTKSYIDLQDVVRDTIKRIGYTKPEYRFDYESCAVINVLNKQSPDIAMGVDRESPEEQGAGDQGIMFGYAINETETLMPLPIHLAQRLAQRLSEVRKDNTIAWLRPDGKSQITVQYVDGKPHSIKTVVISTQHDDGITHSQIRDAIIEHVVKPVLPSELVKGDIVYHINPTGNFVIGGPHGDSGLTGRKIIVDTYGGWGRHGGGAFSGKDPSKVDRSATYMARYLAKNVVAAGLADRCEVQLSYAIGVAEPTSVLVDTFGTAKVDEDEISRRLRANVDLRPYGIIRRLNLLRPIFSHTSAYGHFGRTDTNVFTWEKTDLAEAIKN